jgi:hypothetical protein
MAKMSRSPRGQNVTPKDIANALDHISTWVRSVRRAVLKIDPGATISATMPAAKRGVVALPSPIVLLDGCAPAPPAKKRSKK